MFCTCSRNCSTAAFNESPTRVSSISADFEHKRIGFPVQLLAQEIQPAPDRLVLPQQIGGLLDMRPQPLELLADIRASDEQRHFLRDPLLRHARGEIGEIRQHRLQPFANRRRLSRRACRRRLDQCRHLGELARATPRRAERPPRPWRRPADRAPLPSCRERRCRRSSSTASGSSSTVSTTPRRASRPSMRGGAASISPASSFIRATSWANVSRLTRTAAGVVRVTARLAEKLPRRNRCASSARSCGSSASKPGASRSRRSSDLPLTLFISQTQEMPSSSPSRPREARHAGQTHAAPLSR